MAARLATLPWAGLFWMNTDHDTLGLLVEASASTIAFFWLLKRFLSGVFSVVERLDAVRVAGTTS